MNEQQIRQLWQSRAAQGTGLDGANQLFSERADQRAAGLAAVAADARAAVLARVVLSLREDAETLERAVAASRRPRRPQAVRFGWAMAASVAAVAVLIGALQLKSTAPSEDVAGQTVTRADQILMGSFESTAADRPAKDSAANRAEVFSAGFDS